MCAQAEDEDGQVLHQGQEILGRLLQDLLKVPAVSSALNTALEAREHAARAQEVAMGVLGIPSAADVERLTRRLRSVSQRLEALEDGIDRITDKLDAQAAPKKLEKRLASIEATLSRIEAALSPSDAPAQPGS